MRSPYWSNSKLADWIRGTDKPSSETARGWRNWSDTAQKSNPIRYWIAEKALDQVQSILHWPADRLYAIKYYINNRWVTRTHTLTANSLKPGQWHEFENRLLHCAFDELVNFVEVELAWIHVAFDPGARKTFRAPWYATGWFRWRTWRSPQAGLAHLAWASELTNREWLDPEEQHLAQQTTQALAARETLELYRWWTEIRPYRTDPHVASGWDKISDSILSDDVTEEQCYAGKSALDKIHELELQYEREDTEYLKRLVDLRTQLWT
jgi:hypothetical protein